MKQTIAILISLLGLVVSTGLYAGENSQELKIIVKGTRSSTGVINVGLYNTEANFSDREKIYQGQKIAATGADNLVIFSNLPAGEYAVAVYHDENTNGQLDKNFLGIPREAYGFSNDAHGIFGPPSFKDAKLVIETGSSLETVINLK